MEKADLVLKECAKKIKPGGNLYLVLNHPCFRIPGASAWDWDEKNKIQYTNFTNYPHLTSQMSRSNLRLY